MNPTLQWVPYGITANVITICSNLLVYASIAIASINKNEWNGVCFLIPVMIFFYLYGDHLDGAQAKRTRASSALGEFNDHYLDTINNGILFWILFIQMDITRIEIVVPVLSVSYMAHTALIYEQFRTGWLRFEKIGSFEAVSMIIVVLTLGSFSLMRNLLLRPLYSDFTLIEIVMILSTIGTMVTFIISFKRLKQITRQYLAFLILLFVISIELLIFDQSVSFSVLILTGYCVTYMGRLMTGHLVDGKERWPDFVTPILLPLTLLIFDESILTYLIMIYLIVQIAIIIINMYYKVGHTWVWWNSKNV